MPILTSFLIEKVPAVLLYLRAIIEFIRLAIYYIYIDDTLDYITKLLNNIDYLKYIFIGSRLFNKSVNRRYFNFLKFHAIAYYVKGIRTFSAILGINNN